MLQVSCQCRARVTISQAQADSPGRCPACKRVFRVCRGMPGEIAGLRVDGRLVITRGPGRVGEQFFLGGDAPIEAGKMPGKPVLLEGPLVSRAHCRFERGAKLDGGWRVRDLASTNGLFVNGVQVADRTLFPGDVVRIGDYELTYFLIAVDRDVRAAAATPAAPRDPAPPRPSPPANASATPASTPTPARDDADAADDDVLGFRLDPVPADDDDVDTDFEVIEETPTVVSPRPVPGRVPAPPGRATSGGDGPNDLYDFVEEAPPPRRRAAAAAGPAGEMVPSAQRVGRAIPAAAAAAPPPVGPPPVCPSCKKTLAAGAKICVACGIDVHTGRTLVMSHAVDENVLYENTQNLTWILSWIIPFGLFPIASEAYGHHRATAIRAITVATIAISILFIGLDGLDLDGPHSVRRFMLWPNRDPSPAAVAVLYHPPAPPRPAAKAFGNDAADALEAPGDARHPDDEVGERITAAELQSAIPPVGDAAQTHYEEKYNELKGTVPPAELAVAAYKALPDDDKRWGDFHLYQLLTNAFLHGGIMHLAGNLVFLLVFGSRVNALLGQRKTWVIYPLLAVAASSAHLLIAAAKPEAGRLALLGPVPALGASGAIMGLAGMYFVLFPVNRVYMVIWLRIWFFAWLRKIWAPRGFWVLLFFISFDVFATLRHSQDSTAHWAHLGGFIAGMAVALFLLITRQVDARGGDLLSVTLGRHAWGLIGKPADRREPEPVSMLVGRAIDLNYKEPAPTAAAAAAAAVAATTPRQS